VEEWGLHGILPPELRDPDITLRIFTKRLKISSIHITFPQVTSAFENMHLIGAIEMYIFIFFDFDSGGPVAQTMSFLQKPQQRNWSIIPFI